ncbi:hypothetical protein OIU77_019112 [Salix suchowensis]|uniref:Uncharacterized protein n=1 Tax=Salix suchowensis TaxID=1278906 RepID=A0ABQ9CEZ3_9ROSI|nr:hypothetical protein OIU77_019112 [Salix suchowensis]
MTLICLRRKSCYAFYHQHIKFIDDGLQCQSLYNLVARKFGIVGIAPIRCCPLERALGTGECKKEMNGLAQAFFNATEILLLYLTSQVQDMKHSLGNLYELTS